MDYSEINFSKKNWRPVTDSTYQIDAEEWNALGREVSLSAIPKLTIDVSNDTMYVYSDRPITSQLCLLRKVKRNHDGVAYRHWSALRYSATEATEVAVVLTKSDAPNKYRVQIASSVTGRLSDITAYMRSRFIGTYLLNGVQRHGLRTSKGIRKASASAKFSLGFRTSTNYVRLADFSMCYNVVKSEVGWRI